MRKWNAVISVSIIALLLIHGIAGAFQLFGFLPGGGSTLQILAWVMAGLIGLHILIGCVLTGQTLSALKRAGHSYFRENVWFWIRRISGLALILFILWHILIFSSAGGTSFRLHDFGSLQLAASLLLVLSVAVHLLSNIRPLIIGLGAGPVYRVFRDILLVLALVLAVAAAGFIWYYMRWNTLWR